MLNQQASMTVNDVFQLFGDYYHHFLTQSQLNFILIMKKANSLHQIAHRNSPFPQQNTPLFANLNVYADFFYSTSSRIPYTLPRPFKAKVSKKVFSTFEKHQVCSWYLISKSDATSSYFGLTLFSNLSSTEKKAVTAIKNPSFLGNFSKCLPLHSPTIQFNLQTGKYIDALATVYDQYFESLLGQFRVALCSQPILYLNDQALKNSSILAWLDKITNSKVFEYNCDGEDNLLWYSPKTFRPLSHPLASQLEKQILRFYHLKVSYYNEVHELKQFCINSNKSITNDALEIPLYDYISKSEKELNKIQQKMKIEEDRLHSINAQRLFLQMEKKELKIKRNKRKGKKKEQIQIKMELEVRQNDRRNPIIEDNLQEIQKIEEKEVSQDVKSISKIEQNQVQNQFIKDDNQLTQSNNYIQSNQPEISISSEMDEKIVTESNSQKLQPTSSSERSPSKLECTCHEEQTSHSQEFTQDNLAESDLIKTQKTRKRRKRKAKKQSSAIQQLKREMCHKFMSRELENISQSINSSTNKMLQSRIVAFERVRIFIQNNYPFSNAILFGSNAIGLALPTSDVDILLTGFQCNTRIDSGELLKHIGYLMTCMGWVMTCQVYTNAKVPVIKLEIDTSVPFMQLKESNYQLYHTNQNYALPGARETIVKVDITINVEGLSSAGYDSTLLMKNWLQKYPFAQKIIILFKHILSERNLNQNYRGGVGSYCLFVMIMAYVHQHSNNGEMQLSRMLLDLLFWYSETFNNEKQIVWLREEGSCFLCEEDYQKLFGEIQQRRSLLRLVDSTTNRIMSGSCSEYTKIKVFFKEILEQITSIEETVLQELTTSYENHSELSKVFQNKRQSQKWFRSMSEQHGWAIKGILGVLA